MNELPEDYPEEILPHDYQEWLDSLDEKEDQSKRKYMDKMEDCF